MPEIQIRPTVASDLARLMGLDHSITSESVWQLELRRDPGQVTAMFHEVRLPRFISVAYPRNPFALADGWTKRSMIYTALLDQNVVGYVSLLERGMDSTVSVTDLVVNAANRREGVGSALLASAHPRIFPPFAFLKNSGMSSAGIMTIITLPRTWHCSLPNP
jgi:hypothetical protein